MQKLGLDDALAHGYTVEALVSVASREMPPIPLSAVLPKEESRPTSDWPTLSQAALYGLPGDVVATIEPHTEADPVALLINLLVGFGNVIDRNAHATAEQTRHALVIFAVIVGETSKARKGTSLGWIRDLLSRVDPVWNKTRVMGGLSSGEGVISVVRDPKEEEEEDPSGPVNDDKRVLVVEEEFGSVLRRSSAPHNTLSTTLRQVWDSGDLRIMNKNSPIQATGAHISILAHITRPELLRHLNEVEYANGFGNRFLWILARRSKVLPHGGGAIQYGDLVPRLRRALEFGSSLKDPINRDREASRRWEVVYEELSEGKPGLYGAIIGRAEAYVLRLSALYAVLDLSPVVRVEHLDAALAVWSYAEASAANIFAQAGVTLSDRILTAIRAAGSEGLSKTQINEALGHHTRGTRIDEELRYLEDKGLFTKREEQTKGRPTLMFYAT
ncbi:MAG: DUF3987 domain-containing protein [Chloroflexota bacterium]|nr:MAG: hypothetical protein DLM70_12660 [Chloroflexota bacterium]